MGKFLTLFVFLWSLNIQADPILAEDGKDYYGQSSLFQLANQELKDELFFILSANHLSQEGEPDRVLKNCSKNNPHCYSHRRLGYKQARKYLFGYLDLQEGQEGYELTTIYCRTRFTNEDFPENRGLGPMKIPASTVVNTEHSWPQSKFSKAFSKSRQKGDLHALFSTISRVNSQRGNHPFGRITETSSQFCDEAALGKGSANHKKVFEPSDESKGNIARALFYFSVRYKLSIDPVQEKHLKKWHEQDPVDSAERARNDEIYHIQYTRNPFIDYPHLAKKIHNF